jgi:hypothetical protein
MTPQTIDASLAIGITAAAVAILVALGPGPCLAFFLSTAIQSDHQ